MRSVLTNNRQLVTHYTVFANPSRCDLRSRHHVEKNRLLSSQNPRRRCFSSPIDSHHRCTGWLLSLCQSIRFFLRIPRHFSSESVETVAKKKVEDVMPIATGHEKEELEAELEGRRLLDIDFPEGPFGTKEAPAIVKSYYDKRIVGCPGGEGEDEHDVVWFWLEKGKSFECPVCTQYFEVTISSSSSSVIPRHFSSESVEAVAAKKKKVEDVMPIATGHEKEELEAELEGRRLLDIDFPEGPFGTKEAPAIVKSYYDKRIVGCPGGEGEDEHDVVWFWLEKGKSFECPVCTQYFELEVVGPGGPPDGHGDEDDHH
ncbi:unnamed protein product [Brassica oleracea]